MSCEVVVLVFGFNVEYCYDILYWVIYLMVMIIKYFLMIVDNVYNKEIY